MYLAVALAVVAIFWAITGQAPSLAATFIYSVALANLTALSLESAKIPCAWRAAPWSILLYLGLLCLVIPVAVTLATAIVFVVVPPSSLPAAPRTSFFAFLATAWKFPTVASAIFGAGYLSYITSRTRLQGRNRELRQAVESEIAGRKQEAAELKQAREIQQGLLPKHIPQVEGFYISAAWEPATAVGGDYYDVIRLSRDKLAICIADVAGKGISAALLMANLQATVRAFAAEYSSPSQVCSQINSVLCTNTATEKFITLFYGVLDARHHTLRYTSAGHPRPLLIQSNGSTFRLENDGALIGVFPEWKYGDSSAELHPGDVLLLFTDGITEAMGDNENEFGEERLISAISLSDTRNPEELPADLLKQVRNFCGSRMSDDATLVIIAAKSELDKIEIDQPIMQCAGAES
jgi:phosphoserine phosphatase RsbU/P